MVNMRQSVVVTLSLIALIGFFVCGWGVFGGFTGVALASVEINDKSTISVSIGWIIAGIGWLLTALVIPWAWFLVKRSGEKFEEIETALRSIRQAIADHRQEMSERLAGHREHVGDKYAQLVDVRDCEKRFGDRLLRIEGALEKIRDKLA